MGLLLSIKDGWRNKNVETSTNVSEIELYSNYGCQKTKRGDLKKYFSYFSVVLILIR